jgi:Cell Wall Hydrolase
MSDAPPSVNKLSIARQATDVYCRTFFGQTTEQSTSAHLRGMKDSASVPNLHSFKWGLMTLRVFWGRLATIAGAIRAQLMVELERNPLAVRQGAAAVACIAAAAVAMPVIAHRAAEQRDTAELTARTMAFNAEMRQALFSTDPTANIQLTALRTADGLRARGGAPLMTNGMDTHAMLIQAVLRGPLGAGAAPVRPEDQLDKRELRCISQAIYYEARGENYQGQIAVGEVVMNRVRSKFYPDTVCAVVYQGSQRTTGCQFTFTCDGSLDRRPRGRAWERAQQIATQVMLGYTRPVTRHATHYHTRAVNPHWSSTLVETAEIGSHLFYRFPNSSEKAVLMQAAERRVAPARAATPETADIIPHAADAAEAPAVPAAAPSPAPAAPAQAAPATNAAPQTDAAAPSSEMAT